MKILLISDIHGDYAALDAVLAAGRTMGIDRLVCLGDVVDAFLPGRKNAACVMRLVQERPWIWVRGNHDAWVASTSQSRLKSGFRPKVPAELAAALEARPGIVRELDATFVHANVMDPDGICGVPPPGDEGRQETERLRALSDAGTRLLFCGHTHVAFIDVLTKDGASSDVFGLDDGPLRLQGRRAVINPGRLGSSGGTGAEPVVLRDPKGNLVEWRPPAHRSSYALWDTELDEVRLVELARAKG